MSDERVNVHIHLHGLEARVVRRKTKPAQWGGAVGSAVYRSEDGGPRLQRSVMRVRSMHGSAEHPTQKPHDILQPLLAYACPPGGMWQMPACVDRLVELGELREVTAPKSVAGQHRIFTNP